MSCESTRSAGEGCSPPGVAIHRRCRRYSRCFSDMIDNNTATLIWRESSVGADPVDDARCPRPAPVVPDAAARRDRRRVGREELPSDLLTRLDTGRGIVRSADALTDRVLTVTPVPAA
jgi:hypothetical protein